MDWKDVKFERYQGRYDPRLHGAFPVAAVGLDHAHVNNMCAGLEKAGATVKWVYDPDPEKCAAFVRQFPGARIADSEAQVLDDPEVKLVASACIPNERADLAIRAMRAGKHAFVDKAPLTTLEQLDRVRGAIRETGKRFFVYFSERLHVESAIFAGQLLEQGAIGRVFQMSGFGPHRIGKAPRPAWFYNKAQYGGILCDIGCHQLEQFLFYTGANTGTITQARVANYHHKETPGLDDFGDLCIVGDNGAAGYICLHWFTPDGLPTWGDGRILLQGTGGYIEIRKYIDIGQSGEGDHVFLVNGDGVFSYHVRGRIGYPFFDQLIMDALEGTETAMTQAHILEASALAVRAQMAAVDIERA